MKINIVKASDAFDLVSIVVATEACDDIDFFVSILQAICHIFN